ncbi:serine/threonine-protein kinase [Streptomyces sp. MSC1_001]|uniref:serine/threonine-protein kinase n=1 Tax=Streptomyces sp. MSC1_001 TaxID=2909263 RepID=UPI00202E8764|nr:serine/threonine-protein kinase [Streptomyces sp. MSC1_001]
MWDLQEDDPREIGSFRLVARLGSGGMGTVYLATRDERGGHVAVKTIRSDHAQEEGFRRRFTREATAASSVRSPYTVRVVGFDVQAREPWLATEYVEGLTLRDQVLSHGPLGLPETVELASGLSFGLAAIHKAGLVHRDLKPGNVLLTDSGPKIIDFGLAYAADFSHATHTGAVLGTPGYFSPEQVQGQPVSAASDVFALGAVLTFAASGDHAFRGVNALTAQYHVVHEEPQLSEVPDELRDLIAACMHKDPQERPPLNVVLAHLASLRSYGHKKTRATLRRSSPGPQGAGLVVGATTAAPAPALLSRRGKRAVLAASGAALVVAGAAVGPWLLPGYGPSAAAAPAPSAVATPVPAMEEPRVEEPRVEATDEVPLPASSYEEWRIGFLTYNSTMRKCGVDGDGMTNEGMVAENAGDYGVSVTPLSDGGRPLSRAVIKVRTSPARLQDEPVVVHVKLPKGEDVPLTMPKGRTSWSFRWPDVLKTAELSQPYEEREPVTLFGPYTILVVHGTVQACGGFDGDPRGAAAGMP